MAKTAGSDSASGVQRGCHRLLNWLMVYVDALIQRAHFDAELFAPFGERARLAPPCDETRFPHISRLLCARRPSAVLRRVVTVRINAIDRSACERSRTHVAEKRLKVIAPLWADADAAATVVAVVGPPHAVTATSHVHPRCVLGRSLSGLRRAMDCRPRTQGFDVQAAATADSAGPKRPRINSSRVAAVAATLPVWFRSLFLGAFYDSEATESVSSQIDQFRHANSIQPMAHSGGVIG